MTDQRAALYLTLAVAALASIYFFWLPLINLIRYCHPHGCS